jgi:hypothetical protein
MDHLLKRFREGRISVEDFTKTFLSAGMHPKEANWSRLAIHAPE